MEIPKVFNLWGMYHILSILAIIQIAQGDNEVKDNVTLQNSNSTENEVTIYTESNFWGIHWTIEITNCTDVPFLLYKKASSIDSHDNCVLLYSLQECKGRHVKIAPGTDGHSHLSDLDFDKTLASLKPCNDNSKESAKQAIGSTRTRRNANNFFSDLFGQADNAGSDGDDADDTDDTSNEQPAPKGLQSLLQSLNIKSIMNRFKAFSNDDSAS